MKETPRRQALQCIATLGATVLGGWAWQDAQATPKRTVEVLAQRFQYTPNVIPLKLGETLRLQFRAVDFTHGFLVPDLGIRADLLPGLVVNVDIHPKKVGTLDFLCDNFCGDGHEHMQGKIIVSQ